MADEQVFRFLDLPKELRLMVYDCLPVKTTHHKVQIPNSTFWHENHLTQFAHSVDRFLEEGPRFKKPPSDWPVYSIGVVRKTISSLVILATCQEINSEAGAILYPKLRAISKGPAQVIVNSISLGSFDMEDMVTRLSYASTAYWKDKRRLLDCRTQALELLPSLKNETRSRPVHIAIRNSFLDQDTADAQRCEARMETLRSKLCKRLHSELVLRLRSTIGPTQRLFPHIDRHLHLRMAQLTAREEEAYDKIRPLEQTSVAKWDDCTSTLAIDSGEVIGEEEWDKEWAEGER